jgi:hypothetical protein
VLTLITQDSIRTREYGDRIKYDIHGHLGEGTRSVNLTSLSFLRSSASTRRDRSLEPTSSSRLAFAASNNYKLTLKQKYGLLEERSLTKY